MTTAVLEQLTEAHRLAQARVGAQTADRMLTAWQALDLGSLDASTATWTRLASTIIGVGRSASTSVALDFYRTARALNIGPDAFAPVLPPAIDPAKVVTSLVTTGPVRVKQALASGKSLADASELGQVASARAGMRHATDAGRETIMANVANDGLAEGWARVASGRPCAFCAMLVSRGAHYKSAETAAFHSHDGCHCTTVPVFDRDDWAGKAQADEWRAQWNEATKGKSGPEAVRAFRKHVATRPASAPA